MIKGGEWRHVRLPKVAPKASWPNGTVCKEIMALEQPSTSLCSILALSLRLRLNGTLDEPLTELSITKGGVGGGPHNNRRLLYRRAAARWRGHARERGTTLGREE